MHKNMKSIILTTSLRMPDELSDDYLTAHWEIKKQRQGLQVYVQEALHCLHYEYKLLLYFGYQIPSNSANSAANSAVLMVRSRPEQWLISGRWHLENSKTLVELVISLNSAWFYISEWKSPGALKTDLNYAKRKSGAWTCWARQALWLNCRFLYLHAAALLFVSYHKPRTSLSRGKPNSCKCLWKCLTFQSGRDRFRLAKTVSWWELSR